MRNHSLAWLVIASLALGAFWFGVATRPVNAELELERPPHAYDFFSYYRPNAAYAFTRLGRGEIPLWNPNQGLGAPFLATLQTGVLYPPNWLHLALSPQRAFAWLTALHIALAALFAGVLARSIGAGAMGSVAAGLLYASSLQLWSSPFAPPALYTAAWAPGVFLAVERILQRPDVARSTALACALALQILAGWPHAVVMTLLAAVILGGASLARVSMRLRTLPTTAIVMLTMGACAGVLLAAPQLLPSLELLRQSVLAPAAPVPSAAGLHSAVHAPAIAVREFLRDGISRDIPGLASPVLALTAMLFAGVGRARAAVLLAVAALTLGVPIPGHTMLAVSAGRLPFFGEFQFSFRSQLISTLAIAVCAGIGISRLEERWGRIGIASAAFAALFAVGLQLWPIAQFARQDANRFPRARPHPSSGLFGRVGMKRALAEQIEIAKRPQYAGWRSYWRGFGIEKLGQDEGLRTLQDREPLELATTNRLMSYLARTDPGLVPESGAFAPLTPHPGVVAIPDEPSRTALFDLMSVRLIVTEAPPAWLDTKLRRIPEVDASPFAFENPHALPRAWRALRSEAAPADSQAALARLVDPDFDVQTTVLLDAASVELASGEAKADADAMTRIEVDQPEEIVIRTRGATAAVLVLNDAFYPGWEATLDGVTTPLLRANTAFRAVAVPAGEHVVRMRYRARLFWIGLALAGVTALALSLALLRERVQLADKPVPPPEPAPAAPLEPERAAE